MQPEILIEIGYKPHILNQFNNIVEIYHSSAWAGVTGYYYPIKTGWFAKLTWGEQARFYWDYSKILEIAR